MKMQEKISQYLIYLFDNEKTQSIHDYLSHSEIHVSEDLSSSFSGSVKLLIVSNPDIYKKYNSELCFYNKKIKEELFKITGVVITTVHTKPDLNKFQLLSNRYISIITPWEEINTYQKNLLEQLRIAKKTIDFQNVGNTARTIMQIISNIVFNSEIHIAPNGKDVSEGKFKNRLHTYIEKELIGDSNQEIRSFAISLIGTVENSIDIANKLTHSLNANVFIAETCVISTISAINIIKSIFNKEIDCMT